MPGIVINKTFYNSEKLPFAALAQLPAFGGNALFLVQAPLLLLRGARLRRERPIFDANQRFFRRLACIIIDIIQIRNRHIYN